MYSCVEARIDLEYKFSKIRQASRLRDSCTCNEKDFSPSVREKQALRDRGQSRTK